MYNSFLCDIPPWEWYYVDRESGYAASRNECEARERKRSGDSLPAERRGLGQSPILIGRRLKVRIDYLERCTCIAVMGGTFDPIHNGHLAIAEAVLQQFKPQQVLFVPAGSPPHKPGKPITDSEHRYQMILQTISKTPGLDVSRLEINRTGASYTIDTIRELKDICPKDSIIYFIIGQDALQEILNWKDADKLLTLCEFIAVPRPGYDIEVLRTKTRMLKSKYGAKIHFLESQLLDVSSTYVRMCLENSWPVSALIPKEAEDYICTHRLYQSIEYDLSAEHFKWAQTRLKYLLSPKRFKHSQGVVIEAERLAAHYGADIEKARWAALLHDCAKEYSADKKRTLCTQWGIKIDKVVAGHIDLAHGLLGAESAKRDYYVTDKEILQAIRFHILGHKDMTLLDKIIVLADFIEPYREDYYPLKEMRNLAYSDINKALALGLAAMRDIDTARGKTLHHWSKDAIEVLTQGGNYDR